jgi:hypothetical protein
MLKKNIQGKVFISITIEKDGSLSDIKSVRDIGFGSAEEAIRVLKLSPNWEPGYQNGQRVRVRYTLPINFAIVNHAPPAKDTTSGSTINKNQVNTKPVYAKIRDTTKSTGTTLIGLDTQMNPLYILDGKEVLNLDGVNPNTIESITVLKKRSDEELYITLYGKKALNGVVVIKTKTAK